MPTITIGIEEHIETYDDGSSIDWPAYDILAEPGFHILGNTGTDTTAIYTSEDLDTPITLTFGAYHDPSVADPPFVSANGGAGTFTLSFGGTSYTCHYIGPYCSVPPFVDLEDDNFADIDLIGWIDLQKDHGSGKYPFHLSSGASDVAGINALPETMTRHAIHPNTPGRHQWHNMLLFVSDSNPTATPPTLTVSVQIATGASGSSDVGYLLKENGHVMTDQDGNTISFNDPGGHNAYNTMAGTPPQVDFTGAHAGKLFIYNARSDAVTDTDGTSVASGEFGFLKDLDLTDPNNTHVYVAGHVSVNTGGTADPEDDTFFLSMWHPHAGKMHGDNIAKRTVVRGIKAGDTDTSSARDGVVFESSDGSIDIAREAPTQPNHMDFKVSASGSGIKRIETYHDGTFLSGPDVVLRGRKGFYVQSDAANEADVYPPFAGAADGDVLTWNAASGVYEPVAPAAGPTAIGTIEGDDGAVSGSTVYVQGDSLIEVHRVDATHLLARLAAAATAGDIPYWSGAAWVHYPLPTHKSGVHACAGGGTSSGPFHVTFGTPYPTGTVVFVQVTLYDNGSSTMPQAYAADEFGFDIYFPTSVGSLNVMWSADDAGNP